MRISDESPTSCRQGKRCCKAAGKRGATYLMDLAADGALHGRQLYRIGFGIKTSVPRCNDLLIEGNKSF